MSTRQSPSTSKTGRHPLDPKVVVASKTITFRQRKTGRKVEVEWDTDEGVLKIRVRGCDGTVTLHPEAANAVRIQLEGNFNG